MTGHTQKTQRPRLCRFHGQLGAMPPPLCRETSHQWLSFVGEKQGWKQVLKENLKCFKFQTRWFMAVTPHLFRTHVRCDGRAAAPEAGRPDFMLPTLSSMDPVLLKSGLCPPGTSASLRRTPREVGSPSSLERRRPGLQKTARTLLAGKSPDRRGRWDGQFLRPRRTALSSQTPPDHIETPTGISAEILRPGFEQLRAAGPSRGPSDEHTSSFLSSPWTPELSALRVQLPRTAGGSPRTRGTVATPDHPCPFSLSGPPSMLSCFHRGTRLGPPP